jgi:hypothetical protein
MNREFVSYEIAVEVRELGFNEPCFTTYDLECKLRNPFDYAKSEYDLHLPYIEDTKEWIHNSELTIQNFNGPVSLYERFVTAPLYQQVVRWFIDKHNLYGIIIPTVTMDWTFKTMNVVKGIVEVPPYNHVDAGDYNSREEAEQACLIKMIEIVKNK